MLGSVAQTMAREWRIEYVTGAVGRDIEGLTIHSFALRRMPWPAIMSPSQFPNIWLYFLRGGRALRSVIRNDGSFRILLPQDGVATGAFASIIGRMAGIRIVSMDHGNVSQVFSAEYHLERRKLLREQPLLTRLLDGARLRLYWPSMRVLLRSATGRTDAFLVSGDDVAAIYQQQLGVPIWKLIRYPYIVESDHFRPQDVATRAQTRGALALDADMLIVTIICRLAPEKGLDVALAGFETTLASVPVDLRKRMRLLIGGNGPLREHLAAEVDRRGLSENVRFLGELDREAVASVLGASDIFLYASTRGGGNPITVLEAMSSGCAVVATTQPQSLERQLAGGRGVAVASGDIAAIRNALLALLCDPGARNEISARARTYILERHSPESLRRSLLRATFFAPQIDTVKPFQALRSGATPASLRAPTDALGEMNAHATREL